LIGVDTTSSMTQSMYDEFKEPAYIDCAPSPQGEGAPTRTEDRPGLLWIHRLIRPPVPVAT